MGKGHNKPAKIKIKKQNNKKNLDNDLRYVARKFNRNLKFSLV